VSGLAERGGSGPPGQPAASGVGQEPCVGAGPARRPVTHEPPADTAPDGCRGATGQLRRAHSAISRPARGRHPGRAAGWRPGAFPGTELLAPRGARTRSTPP